jgi:cation:H+ antiporter
MAIINMISSNIVQWTLMAGMIPIIFSISRGEITPVTFNPLQRQEIALTLCQSALVILLMMDLEIKLKDAASLLALWAFQFFFPAGRNVAMVLYTLWAFFELGLLIKNKKVFFAFKSYWGNHEL